jgi:hypothetical protein
VSRKEQPMNPALKELGFSKVALAELLPPAA